MDAEESITVNGAQDEMKWNHKKRTKDCFLMFCEVVLQHERELLSETLNSSQESINENRAPETLNNETIENSTFNSDSDGALDVAANREIAAYTNDGVGGGGGGEDGDSFNSVTCFCGKPFAGRPMIECSGCLTWLHMSCAKVKRKNIPEFYYCDSCKGNGLLSPTSNILGTSTASSGEEGSTPTTLSRNRQNGTLSSNSIIADFIAHQNQNLSTVSTKSRKPKTIKKSPSGSLMLSSSDNIKNTASDSNKKSSLTNINGKLKKMRQKLSPTTKKMRQQTSPTKSTKAYASSSLAAATSLTELSLNHQVSTITNFMLPNGMANSQSSSENLLLKSPIATNNNIYEIAQTISVDTENGNSDTADKYNKRLKLL